jgi:murein DD-endopeptidase MepM/ murein hydrolase activator NlpD
MSLPPIFNRIPRRVRALLGACATLAFAVALGLSGPAASLADPEAELKRKKSQLGDVREREGVLTTELSALGDEIARLHAEGQELAAQEIAVGEELVAKQGELQTARVDLGIAREELVAARQSLKRALAALRDRLVAMYESGSPDLFSVVLSAHDYDEVASIGTYLEQIQESDEMLVERVRELRDRSRTAVGEAEALRDEIAAARDAIAARRAELRSTRLLRRDQVAEIAATRADRREALAGLHDREAVLEGDVSELQAEIESQLGGLTAGPYPSAPEIAPGSFIWPVEGTLTSNFGWRWGRQHEGIDIGAAEGTPIWAVADGTVVLQQSEYESGGYGNYTCIEHLTGVTTCYAHQSQFGVSINDEVSQGEVIGLVGNTGSSFGAHLHFEVRIGGVAQDPLGYL